MPNLKPTSAWQPINPPPNGTNPNRNHHQRLKSRSRLLQESSIGGHSHTPENGNSIHRDLPIYCGYGMTLTGTTDATI